MLDAVSRKNHQRPAGRKSVIEQALREPSHSHQGLRIGHGAPLAVRRPLCEKDSSWALGPPNIPTDQ